MSHYEPDSLQKITVIEASAEQIDLDEMPDKVRSIVGLETHDIEDRRRSFEIGVSGAYQEVGLAIIAGAAGGGADAIITQLVQWARSKRKPVENISLEVATVQLKHYIERFFHPTGEVTCSDAKVSNKNYLISFKDEQAKYTGWFDMEKGIISLEKQPFNKEEPEHG
jgi:hypothetical protein